MFLAASTWTSIGRWSLVNFHHWKFPVFLNGPRGPFFLESFFFAVEFKLQRWKVEFFFDFFLCIKWSSYFFPDIFWRIYYTNYGSSLPSPKKNYPAFLIGPMAVHRVQVCSRPSRDKVGKNGPPKGRGKSSEPNHHGFRFYVNLRGCIPFGAIFKVRCFFDFGRVW